MFQRRPSPCLLIKGDLTIAESIRLMQHEKASYVLVQNRNGEPVGIFTERDVLDKIFTIADDGHLNKPISTLMSRPVKTLPIHMIQNAPEFMVEHGIRHVPIINPEGAAGKRILGIVTLRSVFDHIVKTRNIRSVLYDQLEGAAEAPRRQIGVISPDGATFHILQKLFADSPKITLDRLWASDFQAREDAVDACLDFDSIVFDIDDFPPKEWTRLIRAFNDPTCSNCIYVIFDPSKHDDNVMAIMQTLKLRSLFHVYTRPLDISKLIADLMEQGRGGRQETAAQKA